MRAFRVLSSGLRLRFACICWHSRARYGRVRTPLEKREAIVEAFEAEGMSAARFARHYGLNYSTAPLPAGCRKLNCQLRVWKSLMNMGMHMTQPDALY